MKRTRFHASYRAILRFLELEEGVDVAAAKDAIERRAEFASDHEGAEAVLYDGLRYKLSGHVVIDVEPHHRPNARTGHLKP